MPALAEDGMQYSDYVLDFLTAPRLTSLTACGAVEAPPLPPSCESVIRIKQAVAGLRYEKDNERILVLTFISHLRTSISEYNQGRQFLQAYVDALPTRHLLDAHREALAHFENSILQLHVALISLAALGGGTKVGKAKLGRTQLYVCGDNSEYDRVRRLANSIKHFDEAVAGAAKRNTAVPIAPLWITNDGLECLKENGKLSFSEMTAIFESQARDAEDFSGIMAQTPNNASRR